MEFNFSATDGNVPIPLIRRKVEGDNKKHATEKLSNLPAGANAVKRKVTITKCMVLDVETIIETLIEIQDALGAANLNVGQVGAKFQYARKFFGGVARSAFDQAISGLQQTNNNFEVELPRRLLLSVTSQQSYSIQRQYLLKMLKPYDMDMNVFQYRLTQIRLLMDYLPRRVGEFELDDDDFKAVYINAMPAKFKQEYEYKQDGKAVGIVSLVTITDRFCSIKRYFDANEQCKNNKRQKGIDKKHGNH